MTWGCKAFKEKILTKLNQMSLDLAREGSRNNVQLIEVIRDLGDQVDPSVPCSLRSWEFWRKAYLELRNANSDENEARKLRALVEYLNEVNAFDIKWISVVNLVSLITLTTTVLLTGPSIPSYLGLVALLMSKIYPLETLIFSSTIIPTSILIHNIEMYPLASIIALLNAFSIFGVFGEKPKYREVKTTQKLEIKVSEDEILTMLKQVYGKEAKDILDFLVTQLIVEGYTKDEALSEIWRRLTGEETSRGHESSTEVSHA
ncbi:hypothetical protein EYM_06815 [Ignicoccus islandicus DSM 13165]|uniref:Uncharacterized protein n=1 Tax=Ignicoccus islandicus DSM 13165 TaxID=940295 RepID=A0A0U3F576_9CREN|nr:hypothetical protein [Ignicoccus islandicus]ALU12725.1 hypothetical protein EYM_06815 [Ignicoccus islandicus DSM 13165]